MNYSQLRRTTTARHSVLEKELREARATVAAAEKEIQSVTQLLKALKGFKGASVDAEPTRTRTKARRRKGGKWKKGHPGRPPRWYTEQQKGKGKTKAAKSAKPAKKAPREPKRKKRTASPRMLAALAKARAVMAAKRAAAGQQGAGQPTA